MQDIMIRIETEYFEAWKASTTCMPPPGDLRHHRLACPLHDTRRLRCSTSRPMTWSGPCSGSRLTPSGRQAIGQGHGRTFYLAQPRA